MKILLTGGTGFIGSHAIDALQRAGHEILLLARSREKVDRVLKPRGIEVPEVVVGDMGDAAAVRMALAGCDAAVHTAATMYGDLDVLEANVAGVRNVVGIAAEMSLDPIIYLSTIASLFPPPGPQITVDDPIANLQTTYGRSKADGERIARELQARGVPVVTIYPVGVYGPEDPVPGEGSKGLRDRVRFGWPMTSGGNGCVDVRDLAQIVVRAMEPGRGPRRYMAGGHFMTWREESDICERLIGRKVRRIWVPAPAIRAIAWLLDVLRKWFPIEYPLTYEASQFVTRFVPCDSRTTIAELGIQFRPSEETLGDAIRWLFESGQLQSRHVPRLASGAAPSQPSETDGEPAREA